MKSGSPTRVVPPGVQTPDAFGFEVAIPLVTNPWLWVDMAKSLGVAYALLVALMFWILRDEPWEDVWPAWRVVTWCVLGVAGLLVVTSLLVFRNQIVAKFTLDRRGATNESGRLAAGVSAAVGLFAREPLLAAAGLLADAHSSLFLPWTDVRKVTSFPRWRVITLSNRWRPVLRLYCVDEPTFERALTLVGAYAISGRGRRSHGRG
jgi:hypothetical protein